MFGFCLFLLRIGQAVSLWLDERYLSRFAWVSCHSNSVLSEVAPDYKTPASHRHLFAVLRCCHRPSCRRRPGKILRGWCGEIFHRYHWSEVIWPWCGYGQSPARPNHRRFRIIPGSGRRCLERPPITLQAWDTLPRVLARFNRPSLFLTIFSWVFMMTLLSQY